MYKLFFAGVLFVSSALLGASLCSDHPSPKSACAGWESLQQLRSLIPMRIWEQEFAVRVNRKAFEKAVAKWQRRQKWDGFGCSVVALANSHYYLLRSTFSGENARLLDRYEEFQFSPFWKNPPMVDRLLTLEKQLMKGDL